MKVAVNAVTFNQGKMGGTETYIRRLWSALQGMQTSDQYVMLCDRQYVDEFPVTHRNFGHCEYNFHNGGGLWVARGLSRKFFGYDLLRWSFRTLNVDVMHHPFTTLTPVGLDIPSVLSFADIQHEYLPEFFTEKELQKRKRTYKPSVEQATRVIVFSEFTKKSLVEKFDSDEGKIDVVYHGYGSEYQMIEDEKHLDEVRDKYQLSKPFLYYPAATFAHKNHKFLLEALRLLRDRYHFDGQLILSGCAKQAHQEIRATIASLGLEGMVRLLGYLPYAELPALFNLARLMVFPSLFEGFGLPLVEAMACGCPVVCSNVTSVPEVVGDAGLLFDPRSIEDIAETIWLAWSDQKRQESMRTRGLARAKTFNWEFTAKQTNNVYQKALR